MNNNAITGAGKSDISRIYEARGSGYLAVSCIALVVTSAINIMQNALHSGGVYVWVMMAVALVFFAFAYIAAIRSFLIIDKAYKLKDGHSCYYLGKKLAIFTVICFIVHMFCEGFLVFSYAAMSQYALKSGLTPEEVTTYSNLRTLSAVVMLIMQVFSVGTCFIIYLLRIRQLSPTPSASNFALLTALLMIIQLVIGVISAIYTLRGNTSDYLVSFSSILLVVKYIVGLVFFFSRRNSLIR